MKNTKHTKATAEALARRNAFFSATPEQVAQVLKNTQSLTVQSRKNFSEEEKQHITPKQTKKNAPRAQVTPVLNVKGSNDPKATEFKNLWFKSYGERRVNYYKTRRMPIPATYEEEHNLQTGWYRDTHILRDTMSVTPAIVYQDLVTLAGLLGFSDGHAYAMQYAKNVAILDESDQYYVSQKEMNKFAETVHALALGRKCKINYVVKFALAMVNGHHDLASAKLMMCALNKKAKIDEKTRAQYAKEGATNNTLDTASAQTTQCKKICMYLGLITFKKFKRNTPITINSIQAMQLFKLISANA